MGKIFSKTRVLSFFIFLIPNLLHAQAADSTLLQLSFVTFDGKKIVTAVHFENANTHNILHFKTDKEGKLSCRLRTGGKYTIKIDNSNDSYEYTIPDADGFPVNFTFRYHLFEFENPVVKIRLFNNKDLKEIRLVQGGKEMASARIENNSVRFTVPGKNNYTIQANGISIKNNLVQAEPTPTGFLNYILYFSDDTHAELMPIDSWKTAMNIVYEDLYNQPVAGEPVVVKGEKPGAVYNFTTAANGSVIAVLPVDDHYSVSLKYFANVFDINIKQETNTIFSNNLYLSYPGSKEYEAQLKEEAARLATRDSLYKEIADRRQRDYIEFRAGIAADAAKAIKELKTNPAYFKQTDNPVCAVLSRNKWPARMIVTDVTGSMYPYSRQVGLWFLLEMMDKTRSEYVFFNDGDNKPDSEKQIGATGGIYSCLKGSPDSVIKIMYKAMINGSGGDGPENDLEALIKAAEVKQPNEALILIADNYSPIKDMLLLNKIKVPVRVVLCGTASTWANRDCLELAYRTGGSVHTIEEDILDLSKLHDGDSIVIGGTAYKFSGGHFFPLTTRL
ncbi:hypothetical protein [Ferruginibacter sp.]